MKIAEKKNAILQNIIIARNQRKIGQLTGHEAKSLIRLKLHELVVKWIEVDPYLPKPEGGYPSEPKLAYNGPFVCPVCGNVKPTWGYRAKDKDLPEWMRKKETYSFRVCRNRRQHEKLGSKELDIFMIQKIREAEK
jgi:hypothetical protein